jgi:hypothetical protein
MLVTTPIVAKLFCRPRLWAYRRAKAGRFGPIVRRRGRALYLPLSGVERSIGRRFSHEQLAAVGLTRREYEEEDHGTCCPED